MEGSGWVDVTYIKMYGTNRYATQLPVLLNSVWVKLYNYNNTGCTRNHSCACRLLEKIGIAVSVAEVMHWTKEDNFSP